jgi:uncharacterized protein YjiS (DUF1127 family)
MKHDLAGDPFPSAITVATGESIHPLQACGNGLASLLATVATWRDRAVQRRLLLAMDERMLRDIGISRVDAHREGRKPFWRD